MFGFIVALFLLVVSLFFSGATLVTMWDMLLAIVCVLALIFIFIGVLWGGCTYFRRFIPFEPFHSSATFNPQSQGRRIGVNRRRTICFYPGGILGNLLSVDNNAFRNRI